MMFAAVPHPDPLAQTLDPFYRLLPFFVGGLAAAILIAGWIWMSRRVRAMHDAQEAEAQTFERTMMRTFSAGQTAKNTPTAIRSDPSPSVMPTPSAGEGLSPFGESVAAKLRAANLLESIEGPIRSKNSQIAGVVLKLRGSKKIAVLDEPLKKDDPDMEMLISLLDGVIVPGPGSEPLFVKRFQYFLSDLISP